MINMEISIWLNNFISHQTDKIQNSNIILYDYKIVWSTKYNYDENDYRSKNKNIKCELVTLCCVLKEKSIVEM